MESAEKTHATGVSQMMSAGHSTKHGIKYQSSCLLYGKLIVNSVSRMQKLSEHIVRRLFTSAKNGTERILETFSEHLRTVAAKFPRHLDIFL